MSKALNQTKVIKAEPRFIQGSISYSLEKDVIYDVVHKYKCHKNKYCNDSVVKY